jgi:hypothetical protein
MANEEERARAQLAEWAREQRGARPIDWRPGEEESPLPRISLMEWTRRESEITGIPIAWLLTIMLHALDDEREGGWTCGTGNSC